MHCISWIGLVFKENVIVFCVLGKSLVGNSQHRGPQLRSRKRCWTGRFAVLGAVDLVDVDRWDIGIGYLRIPHGLSCSIHFEIR